MKRIFAITVVLFPLLAQASVPMGTYRCTTNDLVTGKYVSTMLLKPAAASTTTPTVVDILWTFDNNDTTRATGVMINNSIASAYSYYATEEEKTYTGVENMNYNPATKTIQGIWTRLNDTKPHGNETCVAMKS